MPTALFQRARFAKFAGYAVAILSVFGLIVGMWLTQSLAGDIRATVSVSRSAMGAIAETIEAVDAIAEDTSASMAAASASVDSVSATVSATVSTIEDIAEFLEDDLTENLETVRAAMPAAVQAADAVDGTLRALSLFGVDYNPEEPFGDSLAQIEEALAGLPEQLQAQSDNLRGLLPSTTGLAQDTGDLSTSIDDLNESLEGFSALTTEYEATIEEADITISRTSESVDTRIWLIRALIMVAGTVGLFIGLALTAVGRSLELFDESALAQSKEPISSHATE